ncbi:hypothetical protein HA402_007808 [Bradysia odoriphaga]|nr:hypothetical protein HA402_007808 [Bradysia odoriphaga]
MIRRLLTTFIDHQPIPSTDMNIIGSSKSFRLSTLESLNWLHSEAPCFPVNGNKIKVILEPSQFYETLAESCLHAKYRIVMASLYLGIGDLENKLIANIHTNLAQNERLKVDMLLDYTRGTRGEINSKTTLMSLVRKTKNFKLSLYHTPALRGLTKKLMPPRWNELIGLQHMKLYLFDETVVISGANLSKDYFTNRQDRYIMIEDKPLADFYANLIGKVQEFSLQVKQNEDVELHSNWNLVPFEAATVDFAGVARERIVDFFQTIVQQQKDAMDVRKDADTWVFPLVEMGQLGLHHDSLVTKKLLSSSLKHSMLRLASGYFNLTDSYMHTLTHDCPASCSILMAHPNANGFQGAKGPAGGIPAAYTLIARYFYKKLKKANQHHRFKLLEYSKPGWTYHAKGLWYYLPGCDLPTVTLIGSSNFGERSVNRDLETQICLVTTNESLQRMLQVETDHLFQNGSMAEEALMSRPVPRWVRTVVSLFRNYF